MIRDEYANQLFKTRLCRFFGSNKCSKGTECSHAHSREELVERPNLRKTSLCRHWIASGQCERESKCTYAHGEHELRTRGVTADARTLSASSSTNPEHITKSGRVSERVTESIFRKSGLNSVNISSSDDQSEVYMSSTVNWHPRPPPQWFCYNHICMAHLEPTAYQYPSFVPPPLLKGEDDHSPRFAWHE